ncbi:ankyrin repeat domain-containing protein 33B isoform X2 [Phyllostomus discolor]|uniref:Ankyrin repeat domain-containing protein 33B isoform X2 n=1 Tax=Phyllostomus discolor TaxID=89673 RepID=A0A7E6DA06_9CHIR|nr:ankyrin repeat domain-containing protein 33B isoform X2 [Phyllostomus discolor]
MVLLAGPGPEGGGARCVSPQPPSPPRETRAREDPTDFEEYEDFSHLPDTRSIASDDSFYPTLSQEEYSDRSAESIPEGVPEGVPEAATLLSAACTNDVGLLKALVRRGPRAEEVQETDPNGRTGLIIACYHGFVDTVVVLAECPHIDVNWQDNEGNTALITAAQAGADVHARDPRRGMSPQEWATYTGRMEAVRLIQRLLERPFPEQFGDRYKPELPLPLEGPSKSADSKNCLQRFTKFVRSTLTHRSRQGLEDGGVLDHMVKMTTSLYSPAVAIACQTVCPENPPCVGKRRLAVQEILEAPGALDTSAQERDKAEGTEERIRTSHAGGVSREGAQRASFPSLQQPGAPRKASLLPLQLLRRGSMRQGVVIPRVRITKAPAPTFQPERPPVKGSTKDSSHLQLPKWRYKEAKEERKKAEEAEKQRVAAAEKERRVVPWRKRT